MVSRKIGADVDVTRASSPCRNHWHRLNARATLTSFLIVVFALCGAANADATHTFEYRPGPTSKPSRVNVAGTFNGWSTTATPMSDRGDGTYVATLSLPNGIYQYKFVINGKEWKADPQHSDKELEESDGSGGKNS